MERPPLSEAAVNLLDTHILLWWLLDEGRLSRRQRAILRSASPDQPLLLSDISLWEVATLSHLGRIELDVPVREFLEQASAPPLVRVLPISAAIAAETAALPSTFHRDPADRILVATARIHGARLLTQDRRIIDAGVVATVA